MRPDIRREHRLEIMAKWSIKKIQILTKLQIYGEWIDIKYLNTNVVIDGNGSPQNSAVGGVNRVWDRQMRNWIRGYRQFSFPKFPDSFFGPPKPRSQKRPDSLPAGGKVAIDWNPPPDLI